MEIVISNAEEIPKILDEVHDKWFDIDRLAAEQVGQSLTIPIAGHHTDLSNMDVAKAFLEIQHVTRIEIQDTEKVGFYDINTIEFNKADMCIRINCGIPVGIRIFVERFHISFRSTN